MPITYVALSTYAHDHGISGADFGDFLHIMHRLDGIYLDVETQRAKQRRSDQGGDP